MDTDSRFLALSEKNIEDIILPEKKKNRKQYFREIVQIASLRMQQATSSQEHVVLLTRSMIRESRDYLKKISGVSKICSRLKEPVVATIERVTSSNSVEGDSLKQLWKTVEMDP